MTRELVPVPPLPPQTQRPEKLLRHFRGISYRRPGAFFGEPVGGEVVAVIFPRNSRDFSWALRRGSRWHLFLQAEGQQWEAGSELRASLGVRASLSGKCLALSSREGEPAA